MRPRPNGHRAPIGILEILTRNHQLPQILKLARAIRIRKHHVPTTNMAHPMRHSPTLPPIMSQINHADRARRDMHALMDLGGPRPRLALRVQRQLVVAGKAEGDLLGPISRSIGHDNDFPAAVRCRARGVTGAAICVRLPLPHRPGLDRRGGSVLLAQCPVHLFQVVHGFFEHPG